MIEFLKFAARIFIYGVRRGLFYSITTFANVGLLTHTHDIYFVIFKKLFLLFKSTHIIVRIINELYEMLFPNTRRRNASE